LLHANRIEWKSTSYYGSHRPKFKVRNSRTHQAVEEVTSIKQVALAYQARGWNTWPQWKFECL